MLILARKKNESVLITNEKDGRDEALTLTLLRVRRDSQSIQIKIVSQLGQEKTFWVGLKEEKILDPKHNILFVPVCMKLKAVRLGFAAPEYIKFMRTELLEKDRAKDGKS